MPEAANLAATRDAIEAEEAAIREEGLVHGDLIRLEGLVNGGNMSRGKSWEGAKWAGAEGNEAQWIFKCDEDTYIVLPNLLDTLLTLDPSQPTYLGAGVEHWPGYLWYYSGMMYGFTWGVARTFATSDAHKDMYTSP